MSIKSLVDTKTIQLDLEKLRGLAIKSYSQQDCWEMPMARTTVHGKEAIIFHSLDNVDKYVFHYTSLDTFTKKILRSDTLLLNRAEKSGDPLENRWVFDEYGKGEEINRTMRKNVRFCCFCKPYVQIEDEKIPGFALSRMWNQYGQSFKGVCLGFNRERLCKLVNEQYQGVSRVDNIEYVLSLNPEKRTHILKAINLENRDVFFNEDGSIRQWNSGMIKELFHTDLFGLMCCKAKDFRDENEIRISVYSEIAEECFINGIKSALEMVILGDLVEENAARTIDLNTDATVYKFGYKSPYKFVENCVNANYTESFGRLRRITTKESIKYKNYKKVAQLKDMQLTNYDRMSLLSLL